MQQAGWDLHAATSALPMDASIAEFVQQAQALKPSARSGGLPGACHALPALHKLGTCQGVWARLEAECKCKVLCAAASACPVPCAH